MATPRKSGEERLVTRTYRAAIRTGEDFITLEETITLPVDATDEDISQAVELGLRIYHAQREAIETQIAMVRESVAPAPITVRDPDAPASEKQRNFITTLQESLGWSSEQLASYAGEQGIDLVTLTKGQASTFIDGLKKQSEERTTSDSRPQDGRSRLSEERASFDSRPQDGRSRTENGHQPVFSRQLQALERLAQQHNLDLNVESQQRFGVPTQNLTFDQASALLRDLQRR